ncbi:TPA: protease complex subunit PrcB family protein [Clostridium botulinum]|nr:protease complex subunit PrcB family protein [Clostridium botulinum]
MSFQTIIEKKKIIIYAVLTIVLLGIIGFGINAYIQKSNVETAKLKNIKYEILDQSVLSENKLKTWIGKNKKSPGIYQTSNNKYTFVLISGGEKDTTGYGIALNGVEGTKENVKIKYQIIASDNPSLNKREKSYPLMVLRYLKDSRTVVGEVLKDKK